MSLSKIAFFSFLTIFSLNSGNCENVDQKEQPSATISSITMALGTSGDQLEPENQRDTFKPTDTIHAVVRVENAPANTNVGADWVAVDIGNSAEADSLILSKDVKVEGSRNVDFTFKPTPSFPTGKYQVEISIDGSVESTKSFNIKE